MRYLVYVILCCVLLAGAVVSRSVPASGGEASSVETPESPAPSSKSGEQETPDDELDVFLPTEKVPAGTAISFPVDI